MRNQKQARRRNRFVVLLTLPAVIFIWLVGWGLYWIGRRGNTISKQKVKRHEENVSLIPAIAVHEEPIETRA